MEYFLEHTKAAQADWARFDGVHIVMGNEACDLDSAVCAVIYSLFLHTTRRDKTAYIPVLNIPSSDYRLRTEVTYYLKQYGLTESLLTFRDQIDLDELHRNSKLQLTLVDFNVLRGADSTLEGAVVEVIDHHQQERLPSDSVSMTLELVGSCCSLVAERLLNDAGFDVTEQVAALLYGGIVLDTVCLSAEAGRATPKDEAIVHKLEALLSQLNRQQVFDDLQKAKSDVSDLSSMDILRKDLKVISSSAMTVAISSIPMHIEAFLSRHGLAADLQQFAEREAAHVVLVMSLCVTDSAAPLRQLAVFSDNHISRDQIVEVLVSASDPPLNLSDPLSVTIDNLQAFSQGNVKASRKKVLPLIKAFLDTDTTPDRGLAVDDLLDLGSLASSSGPTINTTSSNALSDDLHILSPEDSNTSIQPTNNSTTQNFLQEDLLSFDPFSTEFECPSEKVKSPLGAPSGALSGDLLGLGLEPEQVGASSSNSPSLVSTINLLDLFRDHVDVLMEGTSPTPQATPEYRVTPEQQGTPQTSYPATPPNTYTESSINTFMEHDLPSFNSSEMVHRIYERKAELGMIGESDTDPPDDSFPFTPQNSVTDSKFDHLAHQHDLPTFYSPDIMSKLQSKRAELEQGESPPLNPYVPSSVSPSFNPPFAPPNSYADRSVQAQPLREGELIERIEREQRQDAHSPIEFSDRSVHHEELPTQSCGNVIAFQIAQDISATTNNIAENAFTHRDVEDMTLPTEISGNIVAYEISKKMEESSRESKKIEEKSGESSRRNIWNSGKMLVYNGQDELDVAYKLSRDIIQKALEIYELQTLEEQSNDKETQVTERSSRPKWAEKVNGDVDVAHDEIEVETEYLSRVDPFRGNLDLESATADNNASAAVENNASESESSEQLVDEVVPPSVESAVPPVNALPIFPCGEIFVTPPSDESNAGSNDSNAGDLTPTEVRFNNLPQDDDSEILDNYSADLNDVEDYENGANQHVNGAATSDLYNGYGGEGSSQGPMPEQANVRYKEHTDQDEVASSTKSTTDSELSESIQDFLSRLRTQSNLSTATNDSDDPLEFVQRQEVARTLVDDAIIAAVDIVKKDKLKQQASGSDWDNEELKNLADQIPEHLTMDADRPRTAGEEQEDERKSGRPNSLESTPKKKIIPNMDLLKDDPDDTLIVSQSLSSSDDIQLSFDDTKTPDDLNTPEAMVDSVFEGELDWGSADSSPPATPVEPIPEYSAREEFEDERSWRTVTIGDKSFRIDMKVIEPYKKVLSHGGYYGDGFNAIIVFAGCYLPDKRRRDYTYVMDNLFLYVISTLELLVVEDYMIVYFHGATPKQKMPSLRWLKRCYEMIDRRLRKNLKSLLIVHPTLWLRTIVLMTKPFISSKFSSKLRYVKSLHELLQQVPTEYIYIPEEIKAYDAIRNSTSSSPSNTPTPT